MKMSGSKPRKALIIIGAVIAFLTTVILVGVLVFISYKDPYHKRVTEAGFFEKTAKIGAVSFNYAEGPDNGPALLLLHAQHMDWYSYSRVLPELSESFHVFAVDYHGHGKTDVPAEYMNANQIGGDLAAFIETVIGEPAFVAGNSSGGLLTVWLAANAPALVKAIVLEDPPLFSSEYPRVKDTVAYRSFAHCHNYLESGEGDFLIYWLENSTAFFERYVGGNIAPLLTATIRLYRNGNSGKAVELLYLPVTVRLMIRGLDEYDPSFGAAFYDGNWNDGFDHAEALTRIACPALLIHANFEIQENGILNGAMDQGEADRAAALIPGVRYIKIDAEHVTHLDKPDQYIQIIEAFFLNEIT